jgi:Fe-S cluster assembly scaffold protein SufB
MLGERARVIAMPTLEITADNVVCSHGASVTDLDENSMFYLAARGVARAEARKLLLRGFALDVLVEGGQALMDKAAQERVVAKLETMNPAQDGPGLGRGGSGKLVQRLVSM